MEAFETNKDGNTDIGKGRILLSDQNYKKRLKEFLDKKIISQEAYDLNMSKL